MRAGDVDYVTYVLGVSCLPAMTDAPTIAPTGQPPLPDGVKVPDDFYRSQWSSVDDDGASPGRITRDTVQL